MLKQILFNKTFSTKTFKNENHDEFSWQEQR